MKEKIIEKLIIAVKIAAFCIIFALIYARVEYVLEERTSSDKYAEFFSAKQDFQILFMGNSHVTNGIFPMELYRDYGLASYNFGGHDNTMPTTYWIARNALEYTSPKLMVVDLRTLGTQKKHSDQVRYLHISLDCFPMTPLKLETINDILMPEEKTEFLWKLWMYHDRWDELDRYDFTGERKYEKGAETRVSISKKAERNTEYDRSVTLSGNTLGYTYLERLTRECREEGIELLFIYMPITIKDEDAAEINSAPEVARSLGVDYIDFNALDVVDYGTDFFDNNGHLNPSGARKVTDYLGSYIREHFDLEDVREDAAYSSWQEDYADYERMKEDYLGSEDDMYNFLMLLCDKHYESSVTIYDDEVLQDKDASRLLENAGLLDGCIMASEDERRSAEEYLGKKARIYVQVKEPGSDRIVCERTF